MNKSNKESIKRIAFFLNFTIITALAAVLRLMNVIGDGYYHLFFVALAIAVLIDYRYIIVTGILCTISQLTIDLVFYSVNNAPYLIFIRAVVLVAVSLYVYYLSKRIYLVNDKRFTALLTVSDVLIFSFDGQGILNFISPNCVDVLGYNAIDMAGISIYSFIYPADREHTRATVNETIKGYGKIKNMEFRFVCKDGTVKWYECSGRKALLKKVIYYYCSAIEIDSKKKAQLEMEKSEDRLRVLSEITREGIIIHGDGLIIDVNNAFCTISGFERQELLGHDVYMIISPKDRDEARRNIAAKKSDPYLMQLIRKDGGEYLAELHFRDKEWGGMTYRVGTIRDVTESKAKENALRESEEKYRLLVEGMEQGLALHEIIFDENGECYDYRYLDANKSFEKLVGLPRKEIIGKTARELFPSTEELWFKEYAKVAKTGISSRFVNFSSQFNRYFDVVVYSARKNQFAVISNDVSETIKLERALATEKKLFETTLKSVGDGVIAADISGNVFFMNKVAENITGWSLAAAGGLPLHDVFRLKNAHYDDASRILQGRFECGVGETATLLSRDGREIPVEQCASQIIHDSGNSAGIVIVFRDFTEKKQKQDEILHLSYHDHLTELYNRRYFEQRMEEANDAGTLPVSIVMADVNGLKLVNDSFGHQTGDLLLCKAAELIRSKCGACDIAARLGGDEFVVLMPGAGAAYAESFIKEVKTAATAIKAGNVNISMSFGYDIKEHKNQSLNEVLKRAEDYMYRKKLYETTSMRNNTIHIILNTLYEKSPRELQHSRRVSKICENLGAALGFDDDNVKRIGLAGLMHDIGKIGIEESILNKPASLTPAEWKDMKRHPEIGYRILSSSNDFAEIASFILAHHERWDGTGYPKGIAGKTIPQYSRILSIADSFDAMTTDRPYKEGLSIAEAVAEIKNNAGKQFDPEIAELFAGMIEETK